MTTPAADVIIPVYNEGRNIRRVLDSLKVVASPLRVLICYDFEEDDTLVALRGYDAAPLTVQLVRNPGRGALQAVLAGLTASTAPLVITYPADDDYNAPRLDRMIQLGHAGNAIVSASRFLPGGAMIGCPWLKASLVRVASFVLYYLARVPSHDATNGLRLFSRGLLTAATIESRVGFAFSIELLVKAHRMGLPIVELPFHWYERRAGASRFNVLGWLPEYLRWVRFAFATTYLRRRTAVLTPSLTSGDRS